MILNNNGVDVVLSGESHEWETCEYVRDSAAAGEKKALSSLAMPIAKKAECDGSANGFRYLMPEIPVTYLPAGNPVSVRVAEEGAHLSLFLDGQVCYK